jgi:hypothetical protein
VASLPWPKRCRRAADALPSACAPTAARPSAGSLPCGRKVARPPTAAQSAQARPLGISLPLGRARHSRPWTSDAGAGALIFGDIQLGWRSANSRTGRRALLWGLSCASGSDWPPPTALAKEPCARSACCCSFGKHWWLALLDGLRARPSVLFRAVHSVVRSSQRLRPRPPPAALGNEPCAKGCCLGPLSQALAHARVRGA